MVGCVFLTSERGVRFAVHDLGGAGPALLICHATGFCSRAYERLAIVLGAQFSVWGLDFAGHGDSEAPPDGDFSWRHMIEYVVAAKDAISADEPLACVVGHSMGAAVALQTAAEHPGLFDCAYAFEPAMVPAAVPRSNGRSNPLVEGARRRQAGFPSKAAALWRYASRPPLNVLETGSLAAYVDHGFAELPDGSVTLKCTPENEARTFEAGGEISVASVVGASLPTLCASGDPQAPLAAIVPDLAAALPDGQLRVHRHLGHFGPLESPGLIGDEIIAYTLASRLRSRA